MDRAVGAGGPWTTADFKHGVRICSSVWGDALIEMLFAIVQRFRLNMSAEGAIRSGVLALSSEGAVASPPGAQHRRCAAPGDAGASRGFLSNTTRKILEIACGAASMCGISARSRRRRAPVNLPMPRPDRWSRLGKRHASDAFSSGMSADGAVHRSKSARSLEEAVTS